MSDPSTRADAYAGSGALQRVRKAATSSIEVYDAGGSDGMSAGDFIVGWGSMVRHARCTPPCTPCAHAPRHGPRRISSQPGVNHFRSAESSPSTCWRPSRCLLCRPSPRMACYGGRTRTAPPHTPCIHLPSPTCSLSTTQPTVYTRGPIILSMHTCTHPSSSSSSSSSRSSSSSDQRIPTPRTLSYALRSSVVV